MNTATRPSKPPLPLNDIQRGIYLEIVRVCLESGGTPPGIRDLVRTLGISSTSVVNYHLERLAKAGLIRRRRGQARGIEVVGARWTPPADKPLVDEATTGEAAAA